MNIELDPTTMIRGWAGLGARSSGPPWAYGTFTRPAGAQGLPEQGDIWVCKLGWWTGAPWDILAYARQHPSYPSANSMEQLPLYDITDFEDYKQLGAATTRDVAKSSRGLV